MKWAERSMFLWPGLYRLWRRGDRWSLLIAIGFGVLLNLALIGTLIWPAWLGEQFPSLIWPILALIWGISLWSMSNEPTANTAAEVSRAIATSGHQDTLFIQAQREYLNSQWIDAERTARRRLQLWPRDVESRLLLASVFRQSGRFELANLELDRLSGIDEASNWEFEINRERELIRLLEEQLRDGESGELVQDLPQQEEAAGATSEDVPRAA